VNRAAVVANPTKFDDLAGVRAALCAAMAEFGWADPLWLETTADDPGEGQAKQAALAGVDLVLGTGGDGTITACAAGLAGTGVPLGIIPAGTGNLLARNLGLPMELGQALQVALTGTDRLVDVGIANGRTFVAMAGLGLDARMLSSTSESAKRRIGWAAYVLSALQHLRDRPIRLVIETDGGRQVRRQTAGIIVGNVGWLQGGLPLLPDAEPDDGRFDLIVLPASGLAGWLALALHLFGRRETGRVFRATFTRLRVLADREHMWEVDGEVIGRTRDLSIALHEDKLVLRVPAAGAVGGR
jgi:YegS/Rv2252/BmrU family lipid kinase